MRIEHVTLLVKDRGATLDFFKEKLGLDHKYVGKHAWVIVGEQHIHITEDSGLPVDGTFYHLAIEREDLDEYITQLKKSDVAIIDENPGFNFFVRDLDGNLIEFMKPWQEF